MLTIQHSTQEDIDEIFRFYDMAVEYQKKVFHKHWQGFDRELVEKEIKEKRQWKIIIDDTIACVFAITYSDPFIWKEKDKDPSIYIHRIVTHDKFRGRNFVVEIIKWCKEHAKEKGKKFIRLDTWGDNPKLIDHYQKCGFTFLGIITPTPSMDLPKHYDCINLSLFEIKL